MHHRATCPKRVEEGSSGGATVGEPVSEAMGERDGEVGMAPPRRFHGAKVKGNPLSKEVYI